MPRGGKRAGAGRKPRLGKSRADSHVVRIAPNTLVASMPVELTPDWQALAERIAPLLPGAGAEIILDDPLYWIYAALRARAAHPTTSLDAPEPE